MRIHVWAMVIALGGLALPVAGRCGDAHPAPAKDGPVTVAVAVGDFALVDKAPLRNGFGPFTIEATDLLPAPRKRESFTPGEDEHFYTLRRTVERFLQRKEIPKGWSKSAEAGFPFSNELSRFRSADGIAYAVEGELVVRGNSPIPLGLSLTAPPDGVSLRYSAGMMIADGTVLMKEGMLDGGVRKVAWMLSVRPSGPDAAIPVRAVFAVRAEGGDAEARTRTLAAITAALTASSDGRAAVAERSEDASEWRKPRQMFVKPADIAGGGPGAKPEKGKKAEGGGHH